MSMHTRIRNLPLLNRCQHHDHDYHQIVIAMQGGAEFEIAGREGKVDVLHGCIVPAGDVHFFEGIGENEHLVLDIPVEVPDADLQRIFDQPRFFEADTTMRLLLAYLRREVETWEHLPDAAEGLVVGFLASLHQRLFGRNHEAPARRGRLDLAVVETYIQDHLHEPLSIARLARVAHVCTGHFQALFRDATGTTPARYVQSVRLERAHRLLHQTGMPIDEIAARVGFASQSTLTHAFRRHFGYPPGRARRMH